MQDEPSDLPVDAVLGFVRQDWDLPAERVRYEPVGAGSHNWIAEADDRPRWFVKGDRIGSEADFERVHATFRTAVALRESGLEFVVPPLPDCSGEPLRLVRPDWAMSVFPYLQGVPAGAGLWPDDSQRAAMASLVGRLHAARVPADVPRWAPDRDLLAGSLSSFLPDVTRPWSGGPFAADALGMVTRAAPLVQRLLDHYRGLVRRLEADDAPWVVTHGEPHSANVLLTDTGEMLLIDWDSVRFAPRERDLCLFPDEADRQAYAMTAGTKEIRPYVVELFRAHWDLEEIRWFSGWLHGAHGDTADARRARDRLRDYLDIARTWPQLG